MLQPVAVMAGRDISPFRSPYVTALSKPITYAYYSKEKLSSSKDTSIIKLITSTPLPKVDGLLLLRLDSEACQISTSAQVSIDYHWLACIQAANLLEIITQPVHDIAKPWI